MTEKFILVIDGMNCNSCVAKVENALKQIDDISNISVELKSGKVKFDADKTINEKILRRSIDKIGYTLININKE